MEFLIGMWQQVCLHNDNVIVIRNELEQEKVRKKLYAIIVTSSNTSIREWLHIFDADLELESDVRDEMVMWFWNKQVTVSQAHSCQ
jgi:hypothetical protein